MKAVSTQFSMLGQRVGQRGAAVAAAAGDHRDRLHPLSLAEPHAVLTCRQCRLPCRARAMVHTQGRSPAPAGAVVGQNAGSQGGRSWRWR